MYVIPAFFFLMELIFLFHYRKIYYYHQWLPNLWRKRTQGVRLIILSRDIILYLFLSLVRMLYLLYAIYIVLFTPYWQPGCMLLFLSAMPQLAVAFRIDGPDDRACLSHPLISGRHEWIRSFYSWSICFGHDSVLIKWTKVYKLRTK